MPKTVLLDEWHVTFRIPATLPATEVRAIRRVLDGQACIAAVRRAIRTVTSSMPALKPVRIAVTT